MPVIRSIPDAEPAEYSFEDFDAPADDGDCWQCCGEGFVSDCIDGCCVDAESGCDLCTRRCDVCNPKGAGTFDAQKWGDV